MSGDSTAVAPVAGGRRERGPTLQAVLDALDDVDCRTILRAVSDRAMTARECSETCDLPLSTAYRKLELLDEAALVEEGLRIRRDGKHTNEYRRAVEAVRIDVRPDGEFAVAVDPSGGPEQPAVHSP